MESEELFDAELEKLRGFASDSIFQFLSATNDEATPLCSKLPFESAQPTYSISPTSTFDAADLDKLFLACSDSYEENKKASSTGTTKANQIKGICSSKVTKRGERSPSKSCT